MSRRASENHGAGVGYCEQSYYKCICRAGYIGVFAYFVKNPAYNGAEEQNQNYGEKPQDKHCKG